MGNFDLNIFKYNQKNFANMLASKDNTLSLEQFNQVSTYNYLGTLQPCQAKYK